MNLWRKLANALVYSNVYIGIGAVALTLTNQLTVEGDIHFDKSLGFVFFSTVFTYSFLKFRNTGEIIQPTTHRSWAQGHSQLSLNVLLISLIVTVFFFTGLSGKIQLTVAALAVLTALYGFVDIPFVQPKKKLRDFGMLKTLFVAIVWSITTVIVPLGDTFVEADMMVFLLLRRFLFILALTIPFEIKDMATDKEHLLKTLALSYGAGNTKLLAQCILLLLMFITTIQYFFFNLSLANMLAVSFSLIVSIFCIQPVKEETSDLWYYVVLDGMMILQFIFVCLAVIFLS